jgi:uncharacterized membrane protein YbaN (DUF454 family)
VSEKSLFFWNGKFHPYGCHCDLAAILPTGVSFTLFFHLFNDYSLRQVHMFIGSHVMNPLSRQWQNRRTGNNIKVKAVASLTPYTKIPF